MIIIGTDDFFPGSGTPGTFLEVGVPEGEISEISGTLMPMGAIFQGDDGKPIVTNDVTILDTVKYTLFGIKTPTTLQPGEYSFNFMLGPSGKAGGDIYRIESDDFGFVVTSSAPAVITSISPSTIQVADLARTSFTVQGSNLDKLDQTHSPLIMSTPVTRLKYISATDTKVVVRAMNVRPSISPGLYRVEFIDKDEKPIFTKKGLKLE